MKYQYVLRRESKSPFLKPYRKNVSSHYFFVPAWFYKTVLNILGKRMGIGVDRYWIEKTSYRKPTEPFKRIRKMQVINLK